MRRGAEEDALEQTMSQLVLCMAKRRPRTVGMEPTALRALSLILADLAQRAAGRPSTLKSPQLARASEAEEERPELPPETLMSNHGLTVDTHGARVLLGSLQAVAAAMLDKAVSLRGAPAGRAKPARLESSDDSDAEAEDSSEDDEGALSPYHPVTVADIARFRRDAALRPVYMAALLGSGLMEEPDPRLQHRCRRWPLAFVVNVVSDESQLGREADVLSVEQQSCESASQRNQEKHPSCRGCTVV